MSLSLTVELAYIDSTVTHSQSRTHVLLILTIRCRLFLLFSSHRPLFFLYFFCPYSYDTAYFFLRFCQALDASPGPRLQAALETLSADIVAVATPEIVQRCCDTVTSQGVVALVDTPVLPLPATLRTVLICDGVQDPGEVFTASAAAITVNHFPHCIL